MNAHSIYEASFFMPANQMFLITDALDLFMLDREAQNLAPQSLITYRVRLAKFAKWCHELDLTTIDDLTTTHIRQYQVLLVKTMADISAKNQMVDVKTFLRFCVEENLLIESPAARVKLPRVVERIPKVLTTAEVKRLYKAAATERDKALFLVMLDTGARSAEVSNMERSDVDIEEGVIHIRAGKPRRDRTTYISPKTRKELLRYIKVESITGGPLWRSTRDNGRLSECGIGQVIERLALSANVQCAPHKIRKTFITTMLRAGVDVFTIRKLSGHKSLEALKPYIAIADVDAEKAHRRSSPVMSLLT